MPITGVLCPTNMMELVEVLLFIPIRDPCYIFHLSPVLYIPLESARVEVVDIDLKLANEVQPRRYPRLCKCVPVE